MSSPHSPDDRLRTDLQSLRIEDGERLRTRKRRPTRRWVAVGALGVAAVAALTWRAAHRAEPVSVGFAAAGAGGDAAISALAGSGYIVTGERYVSVGVRVPGRIERYFVEEGQSVRRGDPLVQLDDRDYQAALRSAEAALEVARANLGLAESELRRGESLRSGNVISGQEFDVLTNETAVARATVRQLEADLDQARVNLEYTTLRAPTDGVVLAKLKEVGEIAVPGGFAGSGDLVRLANLSDMRAEVDVNEADLSRVRLGGPATVTPDAYPDRPYEARVVKLYPQVNRQKGTLRVEVRIAEPDERLLPDMSARVAFLADPGTDDGPGVWIPAGALRTEGEETFVWRIVEGRARRVDVEVSARASGRVKIARGLAGGEALVTSNTSLVEGEWVAPTAGTAEP